MKITDKSMHAALQRWRDEDHEDTIALSREQVIELCEEYRAALASHEPAKDGPEVVAWAAFDLEGDFMAAFANERAVSSYVERVGEGAIQPLVRQSALTASQQEVERLRVKLFKAEDRHEAEHRSHIRTGEARDKWRERAEAAEARNAELVKALEFYADVSKYPSPLTGGMGALWQDCGQRARNTLGGQSNE